LTYCHDRSSEIFADEQSVLHCCDHAPYAFFKDVRGTTGDLRQFPTGDLLARFVAKVLYSSGRVVEGPSSPMLVNFDTSNVCAKDRFSYWHDVVCSKFVPATSHDKSRDDFNAHLTTRSFGALEISRMRAPPHFWSRESKHIRADDHDEFLLSILVSGTGHLQQAGRSVHQRPGEIVLYDTSRPFCYDLDSEILLVKIPRRLLVSRVAEVDHVTAVPFSRNNSVSSLVSNFVRQSATAELSGQSEIRAIPRLASSLLDLISVLIDVEIEQGLTHKEMRQLERIQRNVSANLDNQDLSIEKIAQYSSISPRTLNRLFAKSGTTPMRWVWRRRLEASYLALSEGRSATVTAAAFQYGFNDLSHFSRSFKAAFGTSPELLLRSRRQK
jgi:AraC-like DNA-binding protein